MDMLAKQHVGIPLGMHTYEPTLALHVIEIRGRQPYGIEARRLKGGLGIFCLHQDGKKKGHLILRLRVSGIEDPEPNPMCEVPLHARLILFVYVSKCGKMVIELLGLGVLAVANLAGNQPLKVNGRPVLH